MQSKHTPGPFGIIHVNGSYVIDANYGKTDIATIVNRVSQSETEANARLIAAAPDLLSALQELLRVADAYSDALREHGRGCHELGSDADSASASGMAHAAIAKATRLA